MLKKCWNTCHVVLDCYGIPNSKFPFDSFALSLGAGSQLRVPETSGGDKLCGQDWAEECVEEAERIEQERLSALSKEETERFDEVI